MSYGMTVCVVLMHILQEEDHRVLHNVCQDACPITVLFQGEQIDGQASGVASEDREYSVVHTPSSVTAPPPC